MKELDANGTAISPQMVKKFLEDSSPSTIYTNLDQMAHWENSGLLVTQIIPSKDAELLKRDVPVPRTIGGFPVVLDLSMPINEIWAKDANGEIIGKLINLGAPEASHV